MTRSNEELKDIRALYAQEYQKDLEKAIISETSGNFQRLLVALTQANRPPYDAPVNMEQCQRDARDLYNAGLSTKNQQAKKKRTMVAGVRAVLPEGQK